VLRHEVHEHAQLGREMATRRPEDAEGALVLGMSIEHRHRTPDVNCGQIAKSDKQAMLKLFSVG